MSTEKAKSSWQEALRCREELIKKWINNTISLFESEVKTNKSIDHLCVTSLTVSSKYCEAIIRSLAVGCRMPAKALLRVLFELSVKLLWCLMIPEERKLVADNVIEEKIKRWAKSTVTQDIRILRRFKECIADNGVSELENRIKKFEDIGKSLDCNQMPKFAKLVKELPGSWSKELYTQCYLQFNNAVHLDVTSLGGRVKEIGNKLFVDSDSEEKVQDLAQYCVTFEHTILYLVRTHYNCDTKEMDKQFRIEPCHV